MKNEKNYVYILKSLRNPAKSYIGITKNIKKRFKEHNNTQTYSKRYSPWELKTYVVFDNLKRAVELERYSKSGSGKAFVKKHLL